MNTATTGRRRIHMTIMDMGMVMVMDMDISMVMVMDISMVSVLMYFNECLWRGVVS